MILVSGKVYGEVVQALLEKGADVSIALSNGYIALILASLKGYNEIGQDLITAEANVNAKTTDGGTAYMLAVDPKIRGLLKTGARE